MSSVHPKAATGMPIDSSSSSSSWDLIHEWHVRTDIHPLVVRPSMSEEMVSTYQCYNYITTTSVSSPAVPKQAALTFGNNNQRWITPE
jgi:hypothetical protein